MKRLLMLFLLFFIVGFGYSQEPLEYSEVIYTDSVGKDMIYAAIYEWFALNYNSANDVIQMSDKEAGIIIAKGIKRYSAGKWNRTCYEGIINYAIKVYTKDNRYKVVLTNFIHSVDPQRNPVCALGLITTAEGHPSTGRMKKFNDEIWNEIKSKMKVFSTGIFMSMESKTKDIKKENENDDW